MSTALGRLSLAGYFLLGTLVMIFPPLMADAIGEFDLTLGEVGLFFPAQAVGGMFGAFFVGVWSDTIGRRWLVVSSAAVVGLGLAATSLTDQWGLFLAGFIITGIAQSAVSTVVNALAADVNRASQSKGLNILHGVYGLGAAAGPLAIGWMLTSNVSWRSILMAAACSWLVYSVVASLLKYPGVHPQSAGASAAARRFNLQVFQNPTLRRLFVVAFVYNGVSMSLLGWVSVHLQQAGVSPFVATSMIPLFYVGLTAGRFACAPLSERYGYGLTILVCAVGVLVTYPLIVVGQSVATLGLGMLLSGLFISGLFPTALAYGSRAFPSLAGTVTGGLSVGATLGTMIPPWWTGLAAEAWSFQTATAINALLILPLLWVSYRLHRAESKDTAATTKPASV